MKHAKRCHCSDCRLLRQARKKGLTPRHTRAIRGCNHEPTRHHQQHHRARHHHRGERVEHHHPCTRHNEVGIVNRSGEIAVMTWVIISAVALGIGLLTAGGLYGKAKFDEWRANRASTPPIPARIQPALTTATSIECGRRYWEYALAERSARFPANVAPRELADIIPRYVQSRSHRTKCNTGRNREKNIWGVAVDGQERCSFLNHNRED